MRPHLNVCGQLVPPGTLSEGTERHRLLAREIARIESQVNDPNRALNRDPAEYAEWRRAATHYLNAFKKEEKLLGQWIEKRRKAEPLFVQAYELLKKLELEIDFEDDESELMKKLDEYFAREGQCNQDPSSIGRNS